MKFPKPYRLADEVIARLNKSAVRRENNTKRRWIQFDFDELNVLQETDALYQQLDSDNREAFKELYEERYAEILLYLQINPDEDAEDTVDELVEIELARILEIPHPLTHYAYDAEVLRKRDKAKDYIRSVKGRVEKQQALDRSLRFWSQQTGFYTDIVSDEAALRAYRDAGVKRLRWVTQEDEKVCAECKRRDGKIYDISKIPDKPHLRCRCYLVPVSN